MSTQLILTIVATDRPGLVQSVSALVAEQAGNWMDSTMVRLGGEFAGIARVSVPAEKLNELENALAGLRSDGIAVTVQRASESKPFKGQSVRLSLTGVDHPGIVRDISSALADNGVSIDEMQTEIFTGSMTGEHLFSADARIVIPEGMSAAKLRDVLERLADDIMVEIDFKPVDDGASV